jgi:hypothetical protein
MVVAGRSGAIKKGENSDVHTNTTSCTCSSSSEIDNDYFEGALPLLADMDSTNRFSDTLRLFMNNESVEKYNTR